MPSPQSELSKWSQRVKKRAGSQAAAGDLTPLPPFSPIFASSGAFFLSFDGESLCDSPPHSRSAASEGRDDAVDSADTQKGRFKPFLWKSMPEQPLALFLPLFVSLANWGQFLLSLLRLFQLPSPLSASRPSRKLLTERRGRDRLGDREIPTDIMPAVFHGR